MGIIDSIIDPIERLWFISKMNKLQSLSNFFIFLVLLFSQSAWSHPLKGAFRLLRKDVQVAGWGNGIYGASRFIYSENRTTQRPILPLVRNFSQSWIFLNENEDSIQVREEERLVKTLTAEFGFDLLALRRKSENRDSSFLLRLFDAKQIFNLSNDKAIEYAEKYSIKEFDRARDYLNLAKKSSVLGCSAQTAFGLLLKTPEQTEKIKKLVEEGWKIENAIAAIEYAEEHFQLASEFKKWGWENSVPLLKNLSRDSLALVKAFKKEGWNEGLTLQTVLHLKSEEIENLKWIKTKFPKVPDSLAYDLASGKERYKDSEIESLQYLPTNDWSPDNVERVASLVKEIEDQLEWKARVRSVPIAIPQDPTAKVECLDEQGVLRTMSLPIQDFIIPEDERFKRTSSSDLAKNLFTLIDLSSKREILRNLNLYFQTKGKNPIPGLKGRIFEQLNEVLKENFEKSEGLQSSTCFGIGTRDTSYTRDYNRPHQDSVSILHTDYPAKINNQMEWQQNHYFLPSAHRRFDELLQDPFKFVHYYNIWINLGPVSSNSLVLATKRDLKDSSVIFPEKSSIVRSGVATPIRTVRCKDVLDGKLTLHGGILRPGQGYIFNSREVPHAGADLHFEGSSDVNLSFDRQSTEARLVGIFLKIQSTQESF